MLNLIVRQIVECAQNDRLEHRHRVPRLASRPRLARLVRTPPHRIQTPTEVFPRNNLVDLRQRLVLGVQPGIPLRKIKKSHLTHERPSRCQQIVNPILNRRCAKMAFLEAPSIECESARICGRINGRIKAHTVELAPSAHVVGDILHERITVETGAYFEGSLKHVDASTPPAKPVKPVKPSADISTRADNTGGH